MVKLGATVGWVEIGKVLAYFNRCQRVDLAWINRLPDVVEDSRGC